MQVRGRHLVIAWTAVFLAAAAAIVLRARAGFQMRDRVDRLVVEIKTTESKRADVEDSVEKLMSRQVLSPRVEALGLRHPSDSALVILRLPAGH